MPCTLLIIRIEYLYFVSKPNLEKKFRKIMVISIGNISYCGEKMNDKRQQPK